MGIIFILKHLILQMLLCALIHILIMHFHTGNVYCGAVMTVLVLIFLTKKQLKNMQKQHPQLGFTFYHIIGRCTAHGRIPLKEKKIYYMYEQESLPDSSTKIYTRKESIMMETTISDFILVYTYQPSKNWNFIYHMCAYLVQITVVKCDTQPSNEA